MRCRYFVDAGNRADVFEVERARDGIVFIARGDDDRVVVSRLSAEEAMELAAAIQSAVEGRAS